MQVSTLRAASTAGEQTPVTSTSERGEVAPSRDVTYSHSPVTHT